MLLTASAIAEKLADRAEEVVSILLPGGKAHGNEWICGDINGGPGDSLKVTLSGHHRGQWRDWATEDDRGDLLDLWRLVKGITAGDAIRETKAFMGISDPVTQREKREYAKPKARDVQKVNPDGLAMRYLTTKRGLKREIVELFKIESYAEAKAIVFTSYSPQGEIVNRSYRTLDAKKKVWQERDCAPSLYGWHALSESAYRDKTVLLCEGQIDAATWTQWGIPALSVPNGTGGTWIEYDWENLEAFDTIYLAFDADAAGKKILDLAISRLGKHRCMIVAIPKKDANDCLLAGFGADDAKKWIDDAKRPRIKQLVTTAEMEDRLVADIAPKLEPFSLPFLAGKWEFEDGFWFRPGEVTIWGGFSHAGKSTMLNFMVAQLLARRNPVFIGSFEIRVETQLRKLLSIFHGRKGMTSDTAREFARNVGESIVYADVVGSIGREDLMEMMWFSFRRYGTTHFVIDSLMRIQGLEEDYPAQGEFCNRLQDFAKETGAHVHLVAHLSKPGNGPDRPSMYAVKGSSLMVNNADNVLLILRNPEKEKKRKAGRLSAEDELLHDSEIIIEKQRETGWIGLCKLDFDPAKYRFTKHD